MMPLQFYHLKKEKLQSIFYAITATTAMAETGITAAIALIEKLG